MSLSTKELPDVSYVETPTSSDEVFLEIEGKTIRSSKKLLIEESDYFKAMFEGNFIERKQKIIILNDVSFRAIDIILRLFWDERYVIDSDDMLLVLEAACMLQFLRIKNKCVQKILNEMSTHNCLEMWRVCHFLDIKSIYLKAKAKALSSFSEIAQEDCIYQLDLRWFSRYVGNRNLECENELEVFQCCMRWFYENCEEISDDNKEEILFVLLGCLDFKSLSVQDLQEMKSYPDVVAYSAVIDTINCITGLKENAILYYGDSVLSRARIYFESKSRIIQHCVCFIADLKMETLLRRQNIPVILFCDPKQDKIKLLFEMDDQKISQHVRGYRIVTYKHYLFVLGGQHELGSRDFVRSVWVYDLFREKWERSTTLPFPRRDFQVCVCGDSIYIVGGSGEHASVQNNFFWYDCSLNSWSYKMDLPYGDAFKVCSYQNQLFLVSISYARAYIFHPFTKSFTTFHICDEICNILKEGCSVFNYREVIYLKGRQLVKTIMQPFSLNVAERAMVFDIPFVQRYSVLSDDYLYTFYIDEGCLTQTCTLEKFSMKTFSSTLIINGQDFDVIFPVEHQGYHLRKQPNIFLLQHYGLLEEDEFVTDYFLNVKDSVIDNNILFVQNVRSVDS